MTHRFRDLLALEPLTADELGFLLDQSKPFQEIQKHPLKKLATLRGKTVALAFFETSTRTRISFGTAASRLGADTMNLKAEASSLKKGETLLDTVFNLNAMKPDCLVMRHAASGATDYVARHLDIPVVNAGDGTHEHPSQGLLDALTIRDRLGTIRNLNVTILGDILHSRVARSNIHLLGKFGCRFTLCGPAMWVPRELEKIAPGTAIRCVYRIEEALEGADVIMMLRVQTERPGEPGRDCAASGPDEPRDRDHAGSGGRAAVVCAGAGDERGGGSHGHSLSVDQWRYGNGHPSRARSETQGIRQCF